MFTRVADFNSGYPKICNHEVEAELHTGSSFFFFLFCSLAFIVKRFKFLNRFDTEKRVSLLFIFFFDAIKIIFFFFHAVSSRVLLFPVQTKLRREFILRVTSHTTKAKHF